MTPALEQTLAKVASLRREAEVRSELTALNERIRKSSFAVTWGPAVDVQPVDVDEAMARWKSTHDDSNASTPLNQPRR